MKQDQIVSYFFLGLFVFILYQLVLIFSPFMSAISWACILAFGFYPLYERTLKVPYIKPWVAALMMTLLVIVIVVLPAGSILISLMKEAIELYHKISFYVASGNLEGLIDRIQRAATNEWTQKFWANWGPQQKEVSNVVLKSARMLGNFAAIQLTAFTRNLLGWILNLILVAFLLFFFFRDGKAMYDFIYRLTPMAKRNKEMLGAKINETFSAVIRGQFVTSIVQGLLTGFTFWILALPLPFFFGFLTFLTSMIPVTGAATVWAPFAIYLYLTKQTTQAIVLASVGVLVISSVDNILKALLIGGKTKLPVFLLFLGILGGMKAYGFSGLFLGPVCLTLFFALAKIFQEEYQVHHPPDELKSAQH